MIEALTRKPPRAHAAAATIWFAAAIAAGTSATFARMTPVGIAITVASLTLVLAAAVWMSPSMRAWLRAVDARVLLVLHQVRWVGVAFLLLYSAGRLPFRFGVIGGIGDIVVAATALALIAFGRPSDLRANSRLLVAWNIIGLTDILFVVRAALVDGIGDPNLMAPLRTWPLSLLPTFFVPLIIMSHVAMLWRATQPVLIAAAPGDAMRSAALADRQQARDAGL